MQYLFTVLLIFFSLTSFEQESFDYTKDFKPLLAKTKDSSTDLYYGKLLPRFFAKDTSLSRYETLALLIGFTDQPDYKPYDDIDTEKEIFDLNDKGNYDDALKEANSYLSTHPVSLRILKEKSYSLHQLRKADSSDYYMDLVQKIMTAMLFSGNGKTPETAIFALNLSDGERFAENTGMTIISKGSGTNKSGNFMELIDATNDEGTHLNLFFVIQHARNKLENKGIDVKDLKKENKKSKKKTKKT